MPHRPKTPAPSHGGLDRALTDLYRELDAELRGRGAECAACGRCCRFAEYGHQLWVTGAELAHLVARAGRRPPAADGACRYLDGAACGARDGRALACRSFFCALPPGVVQEITDRYLARLRAEARRRGIELIYGELEALLDAE